VLVHLPFTTPSKPHPLTFAPFIAIMSGKLDQSLDEILTSQRRNQQQGRRRSQRRPAGATNAAPAAPAGGIQKNAKNARGASKPTPAKGAGLSGESKIMVSNLPKDVSESQIKVCCYR